MVYIHQPASVPIYSSSLVFPDIHLGPFSLANLGA
jgi:hypothetical protein